MRRAWAWGTALAALSCLGASSGGMKVQVTVDFGPAGKPVFRQWVRVAPGSTVVEATRAALALRQGVVCCDPRDVAVIGGVACDQKAGDYWIYSVDGKRGGIPAFRCRLTDGDCVLWRYQGARVWIKKDGTSR